MHRLLFVLALTVLAPVVHAQAPLGERLGDEITRAERDYFGLFPTVGPAFESATMTAREGSVDILVRRTGVPDTTLSLHPLMARRIGEFVDTFEQAPKPFLNPVWQEATGAGELRMLDAAAVVPHVDPGDRTRIVADGREYRGVLLTASDSLLRLQPLGTPYAWRQTPVVEFRPQDISLVQVSPPQQRFFGRSAQTFGAIIGGGFGVLVGLADAFVFDSGGRALPSAVMSAALGTVVAQQALSPERPAGTFAERLPDLRERAAFRVRVPLDFAPAAAPRTLLTSNELSRVAPADGRLAQWRRAYGWVNVALLGGGESTFGPEGTYTETFRNRTPGSVTSQTLSSGFGSEIGVDVAVRPIPFLRLGATWTRYRQNPVPDEADEEVATTEPAAIRAYGELVAPSPRVRGFGVDLSLGLGVERHTQRIVGNPYQGTPSVAYRIEAPTSARFFQATLDLVAPGRTSYFVRLTSRELSALSVPGARAESTQFPGVLLYELNAHDVAFGTYREVTWGTRFRL